MKNFSASYIGNSTPSASAQPNPTRQHGFEHAFPHTTPCHQRRPRCPARLLVRSCTLVVPFPFPRDDVRKIITRPRYYSVCPEEAIRTHPHHQSIHFPLSPRPGSIHTKLLMYSVPPFRKKKNTCCPPYWPCMTVCSCCQP